MTPSQELRRRFGDIDIYLFDQLLRGRLDRRGRILDAGCGGGRNLPFLIEHGFDICAIDRDPAAVGTVAGMLSGRGDVRQGSLDALPWDTATMDAVICSAVLHFADDESHFSRMVQEMWRVLAPRGLFFARLASSIGMETLLPAASGRMRLPDGSDRFVVSERMLLDLNERLGAVAIEPLKTTNVQNQRCMTTWVIEKR